MEVFDRLRRRWRRKRPTARPVLGLALALALLLPACTDEARYDQAICVLIDVSGTYADQRKEVVRILKREVLPAMVPGDTLVVIRIDSESYEKDNVVAMLTLDERPSHANAQKLAVAAKLSAFAESEIRSTHTDIPGAMMLGAEYLAELESGSRVMIVFSDMEEDLLPGSTRELSDTELRDVRVIAMNVKRLDGDRIDPGVFRERMATWEQRVTEASAESWRTIMDDTQLPTVLAQAR